MSLITGTVVLAEGESQQVATCACQCLLHRIKGQQATLPCSKDASCLLMVQAKTI